MEFNERLEAFQNLGVQIIGVSKDSIESHKKFKEKLGLKFKLLSDPELKLHQAFGVWGKKKTYGKEVEGVIRSTFLLDEKGQIIWKWLKVKAKGHAEEVLKKIKEIKV